MRMVPLSRSRRWRAERPPEIFHLGRRIGCRHRRRSSSPPCPPIISAADSRAAARHPGRAAPAAQLPMSPSRGSGEERRRRFPTLPAAWPLAQRATALLYPAPCAAGQLPRRRRGAPHHRCDLVEGHTEQVVQHEGEALGGRERVEHDEQRRPDGRREDGVVLGVVGRRSFSGALCPARPRGADAPRPRSMSRQIRPTTVVSQPGRLSISVASARASRSHVSCTASSASVSDPRMRNATPRSRNRSASNRPASSSWSTTGHTPLCSYVIADDIKLTAGTRSM